MENPGLSRINHQPSTLRDVVLDHLRNAIIDGVFKPGERLVERVLCERLGVSRTVVRETLRYLDAEGLVEHIPHRGPIVASMTWAQARQIYDIRRMLETAAAMSCAERMTDPLAEKLRTAWEVVQRLNGRISRLRIMTLTSSDRTISGPQHMRQICDAIIGRDPEAALNAVEAHLADAKAVAKRLLAQETSGDTKQ